jgi:hypothetical protein
MRHDHRVVVSDQIVAVLSAASQGNTIEPA